MADAVYDCTITTRLRSYAVRYMNYIANKKGMVLSLNHDLAPLHIAYHNESCTVEPLNNGHPVPKFVVSYQSRPLVAQALIDY